METKSTGPQPTEDGDPTQACEACGHDLSLHDAIATRYCRASTAQGNQRGCMCPEAAKARSAVPAYGRGRFSGR
jgi:hypothetical protein